MKRHIAVISAIIFPLIILCSACAQSFVPSVLPTKETTSPTPDPTPANLDNTATPAPEPYSYDEEEFMDYYDTALTAISDGSVPATATPVDPKETGFAIIPLGAETYGIDAFAILPILSRKLSEEEMLQLAYAMGGISFEQLVSPLYSWIGSEDQGIVYRPYQWEERITNYKLEILYRYDGLRPLKSLLNNAENGGPIYVDVDRPKSGGAVRYWIYPTATMTEEQLLQIIEVQFFVPQEYYQPLAEQLQYDKVEEVVQKLVLDYGIANTAPDMCYPSYWSGRYSKSPIGRRDYWSAKLHFDEGHDYNIYFNADDGSFISWFRCPVGYYAENEPSDFSLEITDNNVVLHTDEEINEAAVSFVSEELLKDGITISETSVNANEFHTLGGGGGLVIKGEGKNVSVTLSTGDIYQVSIMKNDLSIQSLSKY